jgi:hypothetical protein
VSVSEQDARLTSPDDDPWADMFPLPEGCTLTEHPPLSEERIAELSLMFGTASGPARTRSRR